jgi:hypothetical protein
MDLVISDRAHIDQVRTESSEVDGGPSTGSIDTQADPTEDVRYLTTFLLLYVGPNTEVAAK